MPRRLRDHPLLRPLLPVLRPFVRSVRAVARPLLSPVRRRLWRLSPGTLARTARWAWGVAREVRRRRRETRLAVAVDVLPLWEPLTGIGWYLHQLLEGLAGRDDLALRLYGLALVRAPGIPEPPVPLPAGPALEHVVYEVPDDLVIGQRWLVPIVRRLEPLLVVADRNRVVFAPNYILPPPFRLARAPQVATVHDLSVKRVPWAVRPDTRVALEQRLARAIEGARRVITDSHTVGAELVELAGVDPAKVRVVHLGPGQLAADDRAPAEAPPAEVPPLFALCVGTLEPRKNVPGLLAAWRLLRQRADVAPLPHLVLVGRYGWGIEGIQSHVEAAERAGWLTHYGYLPPERLLGLYRQAAFVALASFYEGFGFPAVEAMHLGTPLLLADIPVLREVAGDAALYAPPDDPAAWADAAARLLADRGLAAELAARGRRRAALFTWERAAAETAAVLIEAAAR
jgi:alpha-1,3-rhamnosyl/mannosyltransferase